MKVHYRPETARETYCEVCGELTLGDVLAADNRESESGYLDELVLCPECRREREVRRGDSASRTAPATTTGRTSRKSSCVSGWTGQ